MARIDDLLRSVTDERLRQELTAAVAQLREERQFGLVFEEHIPEYTVAPDTPIRVGSQVTRRAAGDGRVWRVAAIDGEVASLVGSTEGEVERIPMRELFSLRRFGDPMYPTLERLERVTRGGQRPYHTVINAENYHALELLLYAYEHQVDVIYADPPYNTGARDWKYNNHYVDAQDQWRHSKWLSMMERRLHLAKRLLKPEGGVLVVTIDEHEVNHLGMLLERVFHEAYRQMVTIVINPKGVTQARFSRVEEYAFFCFMGDAAVTGFGDDLLSPTQELDEAEAEDSERQRPRWKGLLRSGTNARREDRKRMFYPVLIDPDRRAAVGTGEPLFDERPVFDTVENGLVQAWPIRSDGSEGNWSVGHTTLRSLISQGYVSVGDYDPRRRTWAISYLSREAQQQIESGVLEVVSRDEERNVVDVVYAEAGGRRIKTVWHRTRHDAGVGGTDIIRAIFGERVFSFPKSVYAVRDTLAALAGGKRNALILDFFAGSGTTLHATMLLNSSDGGERRCILVTNNEVDSGAGAALERQGHLPGDEAYEARGVFEAVTRPRCRAVLTGVRPDGQPIPGTHLGGRPLADGFDENVAFLKLRYLDPDDLAYRRDLRAILPLLWLKAGAIGEYATVDPNCACVMPADSPFAVLTDEESFPSFLNALARRPDITHVFLVTDSEDAFREMSAELPERVHPSMLYRDYLQNFRINTGRQP